MKPGYLYKIISVFSPSVYKTMPWQESESRIKKAGSLCLFLGEEKENNWNGITYNYYSLLFEDDIWVLVTKDGEDSWKCYLREVQ